MKKTSFDGFFLIFDRDPEIITTEQSSVNFTPKKTMINFFFTKKKNYLSNTSKMIVLADFETELESPFGNRKKFFQRIQLSLALSLG